MVFIYLTLGNNKSVNVGGSALDAYTSLDNNRLSTVEKNEQSGNFSTLQIKERAKTARKKDEWGV
jgi:hypothetical protein